MKLLKIVILAGLFTLVIAGNVRASEPDYLDQGIIDNESIYGAEPIFTEVTCYIEAGKRTFNGDFRMEGIIASSPDWIGRVAGLYKVNEDGGLGDFIGYYEVQDIGYGKSTHSQMYSNFSGRKCAGTIETGLSIDVREPNYNRCIDFMTNTFVGGQKSSTGSAVYVVMIDGKG